MRRNRRRSAAAGRNMVQPICSLEKNLGLYMANILSYIAMQHGRGIWRFGLTVLFDTASKLTQTISKGALPMRTFVAATVAATLIATSALAAVNVSPLPSGKPAGVKKAQDTDNTVWWVVGLGVVAAGVAHCCFGQRQWHRGPDHDHNQVNLAIIGCGLRAANGLKKAGRPNGLPLFLIRDQPSRRPQDFDIDGVALGRKMLHRPPDKTAVGIQPEAVPERPVQQVASAALIGPHGGNGLPQDGNGLPPRHNHLAG